MRRFLSYRTGRRSIDPETNEKTFRHPHEGSPPSIPSIPPQFFNRRGQLVVHEDGPEDDDHPTAALVTPSAPPPPPNLKVKRVEYFYSSWSKAWKYRNTASKVKADVLQTIGNGDSSGVDPWVSYCFVVVRKIPQPVDGEQGEPTFQVVVKSPYLLIALKDVIQKVQGISWTAEPLEVRSASAEIMLMTLTLLPDPCSWTHTCF